MKVNKTAIFAFKGDPICFVHVLLNGIDLHEKEGEVKIILEGEATGLIIELSKPEHPLHALYEKVKNLALIDAVCRACAIKMGSTCSGRSRRLQDCRGHGRPCRNGTIY